MRHLLAIASLILLTAGSARADAVNGFNGQERQDFLDAQQLANRFLGCVDDAANADADQSRIDAAVRCFGAVNATNFTITIDGVAGPVSFPNPTVFAGFATGPANFIRTNVSLLPGTYTALAFRDRTRTTPKSVDLVTTLTIFQQINLPSPVFGPILGGQIVRGSISFTATEVQRNVWRITTSRFTLLGLESGLNIRFLPRPSGTAVPVPLAAPGFPPNVSTPGFDPANPTPQPIGPMAPPMMPAPSAP